MAAPSGRMSCSQSTQGIRPVLARNIAGISAGNDGETTTITSGRRSAGSAAVWIAAKLSSWRMRASELDRPNQSGRRNTSMPSRFSR